MTQNNLHTETAYFAGGCFWGVEHLMKQKAGVVSVTSGYMGGHTDYPTYLQVCGQSTGHAGTVRIVFRPEKISFETLAKYFFEIHDPEQHNRQGPDIGEQYRSEIFYTTPRQKETALQLIRLLESKGYSIATRVTPASAFWKAEAYHQQYYTRKGSEPYCHFYTPRF